MWKKLIDMRVQHAEEVPKAARLKSQVWNIETIIFTHRQAERHMIVNTFGTAEDPAHAWR